MGLEYLDMERGTGSLCEVLPETEEPNADCSPAQVETQV